MKDWGSLFPVAIHFPNMVFSKCFYGQYDVLLLGVSSKGHGKHRTLPDVNGLFVDMISSGLR